jgi:hypothetical protein
MRLDWPAQVTFRHSMRLTGSQDVQKGRGTAGESGGEGNSGYQQNNLLLLLPHSYCQTVRIHEPVQSVLYRCY